MAIFIVLETVDVEIVSLDVFADVVEAAQRFDRLCEENRVWDEDVLPGEIRGTLRIAGDEGYAVQLIQR